jgi:hypothetical protein
MSSLQNILVQLLDIPYRWWDPKVSCAGDHGPFWSFNGPFPSRKQMEEGQMNCAGLVNLVCRAKGIPIPGADTDNYYAGGTHAWYEYLHQKHILHPFESWRIYPEGTLLLRKYRSEEDQGHLAIYMGPNSIVHSFPGEGSCVSTILPHYYEYICLPDDWLTS